MNRGSIKDSYTIYWLELLPIAAKLEESPSPKEMPEAVGSKGDDVIVSNTREMEKQRRKLDKEIKQRQKDAERKKLKDEKKRQKEAEKQEAKERKKEKKVMSALLINILPRSKSTAIK